MPNFRGTPRKLLSSTRGNRKGRELPPFLRNMSRQLPPASAEEGKEEEDEQQQQAVKPIRIVLKRGGGARSSRNAGIGPQRKRPRPAPKHASSSAVPAILSSLPKSDATVDTLQSAGLPPGDAEENPGAADAALLPCDTLLALRSIVSKNAAAICPTHHRQVSAGESTGTGRGLPFVLKPMLHHALLSTVLSSNSSNNNTSEYSRSDVGASAAIGNDDDDRAEVNRSLSAGAATGVSLELEQLRSLNQIRLIQLHGTGDLENDLAVMEADVYARGVKAAFRRAQSAIIPGDGGGGGGLHSYSDELAGWFLSCLSHAHWNNKFVLRDSICAALMDHRATGLPAPCRDATRVIDHLIGIGVLLPRNAGSTSVRHGEVSFWFYLPQIGVATKVIAQGRKRILGKIRRSNYGEIKRVGLEVGMLPSNVKRPGPGKSLIPTESPRGVDYYMPFAFHLRDLLSRGEIKIRSTAAGDFIRTAK